LILLDEAATIEPMAKSEAAPTDYLRRIGARGGKARLETMTAEERADSARRAGLASGKARSKKKAKTKK
jgi:hypothetical protein